MIEYVPIIRASASGSSAVDTTVSFESTAIHILHLRYIDVKQWSLLGGEGAFLFFGVTVDTEAGMTAHRQR